MLTLNTSHNCPAGRHKGVKTACLCSYTIFLTDLTLGPKLFPQTVSFPPVCFHGKQKLKPSNKNAVIVITSLVCFGPNPVYPAGWSLWSRSGRRCRKRPLPGGATCILPRLGCYCKELQAVPLGNLFGGQGNSKRRCWHFKPSLVPHPQLKLVNKFGNLNSIIELQAVERSAVNTSLVWYF